MTIKKGEQWGDTITCPDGLSVASDDEAAAVFAGEMLAVTGGDLWRVLGEPSLKKAGAEVTAVKVDRLAVAVSDRGTTASCRAVSHVRIGRWVSRRRFIVATSVGQWARWNLAPRAHPNDGFVHVFSVDPGMNLRERLMARRRALKGQHIPHPSIEVERLTELTLSRHGAERLYIDGRRVRRWSSVHISVRSDDLTVVI